jgi:hypothetical protein
MRDFGRENSRLIVGTRFGDPFLLRPSREIGICESIDGIPKQRRLERRCSIIGALLKTAIETIGRSEDNLLWFAKAPPVALGD